MFKKSANNEIDEIYSLQISIKNQKYITNMTMNAFKMIKNFIQFFFSRGLLLAYEMCHCIILRVKQL